MSSWRWAAASARGVSHVRSGVPLQDSYTCFAPQHLLNPLVAIVSDGAGSATFGRQGAVLTCRAISVCARNHFKNSSTLPSDEDVWSWLDSARDLIHGATTSRPDSTLRDFAATLVCVVTDGRETILAHIGDGCAVLKDGKTADWSAPSWPAQGEYASTTYFVTDEDVKLRITRVSSPVATLAAFTDGIERLALDFAGRQPFVPFFERMIAPVASSKAEGKDIELSTALRGFLDSNAVNDRTDDDKTLILAVRT